MKKLIKTLGLCLITSLFVQANADDCSWDGCFTLGAELLWWKPCVCEWQYGTLTRTSEPNVTNVLAIHAEPDFGFRIFGSYETTDGCGFALLSWTYLRADDAQIVRQKTGETLRIGPFSTSVTSANTWLKYEYNRAVLRLGQYLYQSRCANFYTYAGAEFLEIDSKRDIEAIGDTSVNQKVYFEKSEFYSGGLEIGIGGEYHIGCGVNVVGRMGGIALVGRRKHRSRKPFGGDSETTDRRTHYPSRIHCVPGIDVRLGLAYAKECGCMEYTFEVGYELDHFFRILTVRNAGSNNSTSSNGPWSSCVDVGFAGPYASFQVRF